MAKTINIAVNNKIASYVQRNGSIVCGNSDYEVQFSFDSEWDAHPDKVARFVWDGQYTDVAFTGNTCQVPVVYRTDTLTVGVYAGNLCTTTPARITCIPSVLCESDVPRSEGEQKSINEALEAAQRAESAADRAEEAVDGIVGPQGLQGEKGEPGDSGVYIGSDTPPETANVWIDPSGESSGVEEWRFTLADGTIITKIVVVLG